ncbi:MAG: hypothetical protein O3B03_03950 [Proteobacteria bacterium]|nr:hypothetical protein [Pseudomonadota bacterium]MDA1332314.1 hypothetical protein [Pseudomonadota bacterium]
MTKPADPHLLHLYVGLSSQPSVSSLPFFVDREHAFWSQLEPSRTPIAVFNEFFSYTPEGQP